MADGRLTEEVSFPMKSSTIVRSVLAAGLTAGICATALAQSSPPYHLVKTVDLGGGNRWDYLNFDAPSGRVYVSHGTEVTVVDAKSGALVGNVTGLQGSHGVAIDTATGLGYADSGRTKTTTVFDLKTLRPVRKTPALLDADGMAFDKISNQVFTAGGDANAVLATNAATNESAKTIPVGGSPEFLVGDDAGSLYVAVNDKDQIARIDTKTNTVIAHWPTSPCVGPVGMAIDKITRRIFSSCGDGTMAVLDADSGKLVAHLPIGKGTDAAAFDPKRKLAFSSNRDGTLTVIAEKSPSDFAVVANVKTPLGARTLTVDPTTGRVFLVSATVESQTPAKTPGDHPDLVFKPGSLKLFMFDPAS